MHIDRQAVTPLGDRGATVGGDISIMQKSDMITHSAGGRGWPGVAGGRCCNQSLKHGLRTDRKTKLRTVIGTGPDATQRAEVGRAELK
ncbi:hypothetical protein EYF80_048159 [Liparis tanakae]|uniref:Uncharacterized protein n=1 Tax=Liparis tanakae TaxID=230148 RepID=A0A4Z2FKW7_9TELE|nr:hypothetical protein EYF80_048159 [Liparis tanakae]